MTFPLYWVLALGAVLLAVTSFREVTSIYHNQVHLARDRGRFAAAMVILTGFMAAAFASLATVYFFPSWTLYLLIGAVWGATFFVWWNAYPVARQGTLRGIDLGGFSDQTGSYLVLSFVCAVMFALFWPLAIPGALFFAYNLAN